MPLTSTDQAAPGSKAARGSKGAPGSKAARGSKGAPGSKAARGSKSVPASKGVPARKTVPALARTCPDHLVQAIRAEVRRGLNWQQTAERVAGALRGRL